MNLNEVVSEVVESCRRFMIPQFAREAIGQARVAPHLGSHRPVLALDIAGRYVFGVRVAGHAHLLNADALRGRVAGLIFRRRAIDFLQYTRALGRALQGYRVGSGSDLRSRDRQKPVGRISYDPFRERAAKSVSSFVTRCVRAAILSSCAFSLALSASYSSRISFSVGISGSPYSSMPPEPGDGQWISK